MRVLDPLAIQTMAYTEQDDEMCLHDSNTAALVSSISPERVTEAIKETEEFNTENQCAVVPEISDIFAQTDNELKQSMARKHRIGINDGLTSLIYEKPHISLDTALQVKMYQSNILPIEFIVQKYPYIEWKFLPNDPMKSPIRCALCSKYTARFKINQRKYDPLYQWDIGTDISENKRLLNVHSKSAQHRTVISNLQRMSIGKKNDFKKV